MDINVTASSNWNVISGSDLVNSIQTKVPTTEDFIKPDLEDILSSERAVLLGSGTNTNQPTCELTIRVFPKYKIDSLTVVCTSPKIELFFGQQSEYVETIYGERLQGEDEGDDINGYRYDVEIQKSGVTHLMLKLITTSNELCFYGIQLNVAPNPNGITTLLPNSINLDNVKEMLNNSNQKLSPSAEKCKMFLETYKSAMGSGMLAGNVGLLKGFEKNLLLGNPDETKPPNLKLESENNVTVVCDFKNYIDKRLQEAETRILRKLEAIEEEQNRKLDRILMILGENI